MSETALAAVQRQAGAATAMSALSAARDMSGRQKAAVLLVALGADSAAKVMQLLPQSEIETLSLEMAKTRNVPPEAVSAVVGEALDTMRAYEYLAEGGVDYAREVLERSLGPERAAELIGRLTVVMERRPFDFLRKIPAEHIHAFLRNESAQTIALVVANLHTKLAAAVLAAFDDDQQTEIALRIATMNETTPDVVRAVEDVVRQKLSDVITQEYGVTGGVGSLAGILNFVDRSTERNVLDTVAESDPQLAEELRSLLFTFEDVLGLDDRSIQLVLRETEQSDIALSLKGVEPEARERIFTNMSERGAELLREEIEFMPPQRRRTVEEAQGRVVAVVRRLEESGQIALSRGGEDDLIV